MGRIPRINNSFSSSHHNMMWICLGRNELCDETKKRRNITYPTSKKTICHVSKKRQIIRNNAHIHLYIPAVFSKNLGLKLAIMLLVGPPNFEI